MTKQMPIRRLAATLTLCAALSACEKNPIDSAIEEALDFSGVFRATDGTEIELTGEDAVILRVGSTPLIHPLNVGEVYIMGAYATETPGEYRGYVRDHIGMLGHGRILLEEEAIRIERMDMGVPSGEQLPGQSTWRKIGEASPPSQPTDPDTGNGGGTAASTVLLYTKNLEGDERSSKYFTVTIPSGTKRLVVETFAEDQWGRNMNDLFVNPGSKPSVTSHWPYKWTARCASVKPNLENDVCEIPNPPAGTWHILVYGYHAYYSTSLKVTIDR